MLPPLPKTKSATAATSPGWSGHESSNVAVVLTHAWYAWRRSLAEEIAAVDEDVLAGHVVGSRRRQEHHDLGDVVGVAHAADRHLRDHRVGDRLALGLVHLAGLRETRRAFG